LARNTIRGYTVIFPAFVDVLSAVWGVGLQEQGWANRAVEREASWSPVTGGPFPSNCPIVGIPFIRDGRAGVGVAVVRTSSWVVRIDRAPASSDCADQRTFVLEQTHSERMRGGSR
jgi:hypothetical protein